MKVDDIIAVHLTNLPILIVTQGLASGRCMLLENRVRKTKKEDSELHSYTGTSNNPSLPTGAGLSKSRLFHITRACSAAATYR